MPIEFDIRVCQPDKVMSTEAKSMWISLSRVDKAGVCLFNLILYVPSTIFQVNRDGSSWVEPVLS